MTAHHHGVPLPAFAGVVAKADEDAAPEHGAWIRGPRKGPVGEWDGTGGNRRHVPDAGDEIAEGEEPVTEPGEPALRPIERLLVHSEDAAKRGCADRPSEHVAQCDSAHA